MLDSVTKKRIDDLRDVLVGKIPSPQSQVEQITTGLIYKFMYDMDVEAVEMGGVPSFFVDDYEKYSWKHLFDPKLGGADKVQLYSDAIENMYTNPSAPQLFREIFKNSFLPFKDPSTLNMFLKEINEFHYSHSEKLGDAFEYLLSFMGSQGDAGQFRTPRHIIDFIVEIVNPQKNETILDPACGTAGFLISSYKHILSQNTDKKLGDKLNASDRKQVGDNLVGYDISPDMTRISLVNMYLHQFASPQIHEYDTLSSEDRWNEYYDVILANPPFFSPTGGIQPHSRFGVQSTRAEVLFVDYIMEHLKPSGRAGIVVPEGIIFQNGNAYKTLRKKLVDDCLVGVISLPVGVFQPYSGVKTSILLLDKNLGKQTEDIVFGTVKNDGFSLNSHRTPIEKNDLPNLILEFNKWTNGDYESNSSLVRISKNAVLENNDISFSVNAYIEQKKINSEFPIVELGEVCDFEGGTQPPKSTFIEEERDGYIRLIQTRDYKSDKFKVFIPKTERHKTCNATDIMIGRYGPPVFQILRGLTGAYNVALMKCVPNKEVLSHDWLYHLLKSDFVQERIIGLSERVRQSGVRPDDLRTQKVPLPSVEIQKEIVSELTSYQKVVDGCKQVIKNYKPLIKVEPHCEIVKLGDVCTITMGQSPSSEFYNEVGEGLEFHQGKTNFGETYLEASGVWASQYNKVAEPNSILMSVRAPVGPVNITNRKIALGRGLCGIKTNDDCEQMYLFYILQSMQHELTHASHGSTFDNINRNTLLNFEIPFPTIDTQIQIVNEQQEYQRLVDGNKTLMTVFLQKIQDRMREVWGE